MLIQLSRANPAWARREAASEVQLAVMGDSAYLTTGWRATAGQPQPDDHHPVGHRERVVACLAHLADRADRDQWTDVGAPPKKRRRWATMAQWRTERENR